MTEPLSQNVDTIKFGRSELVAYMHPSEWETSPWDPRASFDPARFDPHVAKAIYEDYLNQAVEDEQLGFDAIFVTEHRGGAWGSVPSPNVMMSALVQRTTQIRICSAVNVMAEHNPVRLVEEWAMLDVLSGGRIEAGLGRHGDHAQFQEAADLVRTALHQRTFTYAGRHHRCDMPTSIFPSPLQRPFPVWIAASSNESIALAARLGFGVLVSDPSPVTSRAAAYTWLDRMNLFFVERERAGCSASMANVILAVDLCVASTDREAEEMYLTSLDREFWLQKTIVAPRLQVPADVVERFERDRARIDPLASGTALIGSPTTVRMKLNRLISSGVRRFLLRVGLRGYPRRVIRETMRAFATAVAPEHVLARSATRT